MVSDVGERAFDAVTIRRKAALERNDSVADIHLDTTYSLLFVSTSSRHPERAHQTDSLRSFSY
jgi:hypothetical protein